MRKNDLDRLFSGLNFLMFQHFSSPELGQAELLGYRDVRRPSYVWTSVTSEMSETYVTSEMSFRELYTCVHPIGNSVDPKFMKICQDANHDND